MRGLSSKVGDADRLLVATQLTAPVKQSGGQLSGLPIHASRSQNTTTHLKVTPRSSVDLRRRNVSAGGTFIRYRRISLCFTPHILWNTHFLLIGRPRKRPNLHIAA